MTEPDTLRVLIASYDEPGPANSDYEAVKQLYDEVKTSHGFDAAVVLRDGVGNMEVVRKHEDATRHGAVHGLKWGLAIGVAAALLPGVALVGGLAAGGSAGAAIGAVAGHIKGGLDNDDLRGITETLERGQAALIVVYATEMADQISARVSASQTYVSKDVQARVEELEKQMREADHAR
jgi:uncharacterized membrane protein